MRAWHVVRTSIYSQTSCMNIFGMLTGYKYIRFEHKNKRRHLFHRYSEQRQHVACWKRSAATVALSKGMYEVYLNWLW